jgi:hypothetical protein
MMRRTASEILSDLEIRVARLEHLTASETEAGIGGWLKRKIFDERSELLQNLLEADEIERERYVHPHRNYVFCHLRDVKRHMKVEKNEMVFCHLKGVNTWGVVVSLEGDPREGSYFGAKITDSDDLLKDGSGSGSLSDYCEQLDLQYCVPNKSDQKKFERSGMSQFIYEYRLTYEEQREADYKEYKRTTHPDYLRAEKKRKKREERKRIREDFRRRGLIN